MDRAITANAQGTWNPAASAQTGAMYDELKGMQTTDRDRFANLDLLHYYGSVPAAQFQELQNDQALVRKQDPAAAQDQARLMQALVFANPIFEKAGIDPDPSSANYNIAVGRLDSALSQWSSNNNNKTPDAGQIVQIARQTLFPAGPSEQPGSLGGALLSALSPDEALARSAASDDKNTDAGTNTGAKVVVSQGRSDEAGGLRGRVEEATRDPDSMAGAGKDSVYSKGQPSAEDEQETPGLWQSLTEKHAKLTLFTDAPPDAVSYRTADGEQFDAPAKADWTAVYQAGKANGMNPMAALRAIGQFGTFDFQRDEAAGVLYKKYVDASNFAVGVYMRGAGFSLWETKILGELYAFKNSSNFGEEKQPAWWTKGWEAADKGMYPAKSQ